MSLAERLWWDEIRAYYSAWAEKLDAAFKADLVDEWQID